MADKLMHIPNDNTQSYLFCRLQSGLKCMDTEIDGPTNQNLLKV